MILILKTITFSSFYFKNILNYIKYINEFLNKYLIDNYRKPSFYLTVILAEGWLIWQVKLIGKSTFGRLLAWHVKLTEFLIKLL